MLLWKEFFTRFTIVFAFVSAFSAYGNGLNTFNNISPLGSPSKKNIVSNILKKITNMTSSYLSKTPDEQKAVILKKIEQRLKISARSMGSDSDKYVKFIMEGIKYNTLGKLSKNNTLKTDGMELSLQNDIMNSTNNTNVKIEDVSDSIENEKIDDDIETKENLRKQHHRKTKEELLLSIEKKLEILSRNYLKHLKTPQAKKAALKVIKKKFMKAAKKKLKDLHDQHADIKEYKNLIAKGFNILIQRTLAQDEGRRHNVMALDLNDMHNVEHLLNTTIDEDNINEIVSYKNDTKTSPEVCNNAIEETCFVMRSLNKITCSDGRNVPIDRLCNGKSDCIDGSDEINCTGHVMDKLHKASKLITEIDDFLAKKCFKPNIAESIISPQNKVLYGVLQTQIAFLNVYSRSNVPNTINRSNYDGTFSKTLNEAALLLGTLVFALEKSLCSPNNKTDVDNFTELLDMELDELPIETWSPRSCTCAKQFCLDPNCPTPCKRVCYYKYTLARWNCQAADGDNSINLDLICDGKLDCLDETDENKCATGSYSKFESIDIYREAMEMILEKTKLKEYEASRNNLLALYGLVKNLQRATITSSTDQQTIKSIRAKTFDMLVNIYDDLVQRDSLPELDVAYSYLVVVNERIVEAMKRSRTGNNIILTPGQCVCREGLCVQRWCIKKCIKTCVVEPLLTKFACNSASNTSISIEDVCNKVKDCPNGEDEIRCSKEICRPHHLVTLRYKLRSVGQHRKGTALGEVLSAWKTKVKGSLVVAEKINRITPKTLVNVVATLLKDLVHAYSTLDDKILYNDYVLGEFRDTAKIVTNTLKSCGK